MNASKGNPAAAAALAASCFAIAGALADSGGSTGPIPSARPPQASTGPIPSSREPAGAGARDAAPESLVARNGAEAAVWVTISQAGVVRTGGCVEPGKEARFELERSLGPAKVRGELAGGADCRPPVLCDASTEQAADRLEFRGAAQRCSWQRSAGAPALGGLGSYELVLANHTSAPAWLTVYRESALSSSIIRVGCVPANSSRKFFGFEGGSSLTVRTEMTKNANCQQPVACDTRMKQSLMRTTTLVGLKASPKNCWLEGS